VYHVIKIIFKIFATLRVRVVLTTYHARCFGIILVHYSITKMNYLVEGNAVIIKMQ